MKLIWALVILSAIGWLGMDKTPVAPTDFAWAVVLEKPSRCDFRSLTKGIDGSSSVPEDVGVIYVLADDNPSKLISGEFEVKALDPRGHVHVYSQNVDGSRSNGEVIGINIGNRFWNRVPGEWTIVLSYLPGKGAPPLVIGEHRIDALPVARPPVLVDAFGDELFEYANRLDRAMHQNMHGISLLGPNHFTKECEEGDYYAVGVGVLATFNKLKLDRYARAGLAFEIATGAARQAGVLPESLAGFEFAFGIPYRDFSDAKDLGDTELTTLVIPRGAFNRYVAQEITSQDLIDQSIVLVNGDRISVRLQR